MNHQMSRLFRYGLTAGAAAVVDIGGFALLHRFGLPLVPAAAASFLVATVVNYLLTARHVFHADTSLSGYLRFLSAAGVGFVLNVGVTTAVAQILGVPALLAKVIGVGVAFLANFALNTLFVFRKKIDQDGADR